MASYQGITFAKDYNKSFADFKDEFGSCHVFKNIPSNKREHELKKAYKIATEKNGKLPNSIKKEIEPISE